MTAEPDLRSAEEIKSQQVAYHDWESSHYDDKWSISFDARCIDYAVGRFRRAIPDPAAHFAKVLEVGCGTGFFLLNLAQAGVVGEAHCTDIAQGMVDVCVENGRRLGIPVRGQAADAEALPYDDASFDLVIGHAVVHHLPDLPRAFAELRRVLRPGGRLVIAGEPTRTGDAIAARFKRLARGGVLAAARLLGPDRVLADGLERLPEEERRAAALEAVVDLHIFSPDELERLAADAGFIDVFTVTEELTANWFGWSTRTVEALLRPGILPAGYPFFAYRTWKALFAFDELVARRIIPKPWFYNCILAATAPAPTKPA